RLFHAARLHLPLRRFERRLSADARLGAACHRIRRLPADRREHALERMARRRFDRGRHRGALLDALLRGGLTWQTTAAVAAVAGIIVCYTMIDGVGTRKVGNGLIYGAWLMMGN